MLLHNDKDSFSDVILSVSRAMNIAPALIEKDYFVTLLLKLLNERIPGLLFKGGTSLSKCYKLIDRFSEDIDLTLDDAHFTQSKKRTANKEVMNVCDELGFVLLNKETLRQHSHGSYNSYNIEYPVIFPNSDAKPFLKIEMVFLQKSYPNNVRQADSYIGTWLINSGNIAAAKEYGLLPFDINVQSLERTLIDKVFAICDYYLRGESIRNSRHIYDIYKLLTCVQLDETILKPLAEKVRTDRQSNKTCLSAKENIHIPTLLHEIIITDFFKKDYLNTTDKLLIKHIPYEKTIVAIDKIIESNIFKDKD